MSYKTKIQWCDSTVNPTMGCPGCELYPKPGVVCEYIAEAMNDAGASTTPNEVRAVYKKLVDDVFLHV